MIRKFIFGGCNTRMNASYADNNLLYFCSQSNIIVSNKNCAEDVIFLENYLNFIKVNKNCIISGDITGNFYSIFHRKIEKVKFDESVQNGCILPNNVFAIIFLRKIILYDVKSKLITQTFSFDKLISAIDYKHGFLFIGFVDGVIKVYNLECVFITKIDAHLDRIQDLSCVLIDDELYISSSSKDCTVHIWKLVNDKFEHVQTLTGHRDWVYNVKWTDESTLLTSSADKTVIVWNRNNGVWSSDKIYGGAKAFYNAFLLGGKVCAQSHSGAFYKFEDQLVDFISGHTNELTSVDWNGEFLLSTSVDGTARIFYGNREISRPLSHGYALTTGKFLNKSDLSIIVGAQETIIRVFEPTYLFYQSYEWIRNKRSLDLEDIHLYNTKNFFENIGDYKIAAIPAELSLTNDVIEEYNFEGLNEYLLSSTTFSEKKKLYGHYFEVSDIAVSDKYFASCNKSLTKKFSGIFLWNKNYDLIDYLEVHSYGILKLRFSKNGNFLCAVSKDKTSSLYEIEDKLVLKYINRNHKRIIWDCAFSYDNKFYATCSRDKQIVIYNLETENTFFEKLKFESEVTSIDFSPKNYSLMAGLESGEILCIEYINLKFVCNLEKSIKAHSQKVTSVRFNEDGRSIASCGKDGLLNIFKF